MDAKYAQSIIDSVQHSYDTIADHFSETRQAPWPEFSALIAQITKEDSVLDIGCGNGRLARDILPTGASYTGTDISSQLIELAKQQNPEPEFVVADMTSLPFPENSFTVLTAIASLQHVPSRNFRIAALQEMYRVAQPGALLFMTNWNLYQPHMPDYQHQARMAFAEQWEPGDCLVPWNTPQGQEKALRYYHAYTEESLTHELEQAGWQEIQHEYWARGEKRGPEDGFNILTVAYK